MHHFEKVHILNYYLFWRKSSSETEAVLKKVFIFKKYLIRKSIVTKKYLQEGSSWSRQLDILKKNISAKISHFIIIIAALEI